MTEGITEFEEAFRRDPTDGDTFAALQRSYKEEGRLAELAALLERRAGHLRDDQKAADLLWRASELHAELKNEDAELRVLIKASRSSKGHTRTLERLREIYAQRESWTELLGVLQLQIDAIASSGGEGKRLARLEHEAGRIWEERFQRLDRAIQHYQRAFKADPSQTVSIEAGRRVYRSVGQWKTVAALYQVELSTCSEAARKVELLLELGRLQAEKLGEMEAAARALTDALQLRPGDEAIMESLAEVYASREWPTPGGLDKAAAAFLQIAQARQVRGDRDGAITSLRRALATDPENEAAYSRLQKTFEETGRWEDLERLYRQRLSVATEMESFELLMRRGELLERRLGDRKGARECYEAVLVHEPLGGPASNRLLQLYRAERDYDKLVQLHQRALESTQDRATRIRLMMEIASVQRDNLGNPDAAARLLHEVLQLEPEHRKALAAYEDYFRQKGDYLNLTELLRFAAQSAIEGHGPPMEICARLEELADVAERHLGDLEGAIAAWQQIAQLHPDVQRSQETIGRLGAKLQLWQGVAHMLERELIHAATPAQRLEALRRMAQVYYDKKAEPQRAAAILRELLQHNPGDENALRMLTDICEREADYEGLAWALEVRLHGVLTSAELTSVLRQLGELYADKLGRPKDALRVLAALVEQSPADAKAYDSLQALLRKTDDLEGLARCLELRSQASRSEGERLASLKELARLTEEQLEHPARAAAYWEEVRALDREDLEARQALSRLYDRMGRFAQLLDVLKELLRLSTEQPPAQRSALLRRIAVVADEKLGLSEEAVAAYEQLAELLPGDREALDALSRLYARLERFADLCTVLERRLELTDDPEQRVVLAFKQGDLLEERLADLEGAATVYRRIIEEYAPGDLDAHRKLKDLYLRRGDFRGACEIAERELFLTPADSPDCRSLALQIATLWREQLQDDSHALLAYERVLELDPETPDALFALRRLYHRTGAYPKLSTIAPAVFAALADQQERLILLLEVAEVFEVKLYEPEVAFEWYRRAHDLFPRDPRALEQIKRLAQQYKLWEELIAAYLESRKQAPTIEDQIMLTREVARICLGELKDPTRAFQVLQQGLRIDPRGTWLVGDLEQLADQAHLHREMLEVYDRIIAAVKGDSSTQRRLIWCHARVAEQQLGDAATALADLFRLLPLTPAEESAAVLSEIERLAGPAGAWEQVIDLHGHRFQAATSSAERLAILKHVATLIEEQLGDLGRAFLVRLQAFILAPEDWEELEQLWRLALAIDTAQPRELEDSEDELSEVSAVDIELLEETLTIAPAGKPRRSAAAAAAPRSGGARPPAVPSAAQRRPPPIPGAQPLRVFAPRPAAAFSPWHELAQAYLKLPAADRPTRIKHLLAVAQIWAEGAHDLERACGAVAEAAALDIEDPAVEQWLLQLAGPPYQRLDLLIRLYSEAVERTADGQTLVRLQLKAGDLLVAHGRPDQALSHYAAVLAIEPAHPLASQHVHELLVAAQRYADLVSVLQRQLDALWRTLGSAQRKERLLELADLYQHQLQRSLEAAELLSRAVHEDPRDVQVLVRLADLYEALSLWPKLIETLEAALQLVRQTSERCDYLLRIGRTYDEELELPDRAITAYQQVLKEQPNHPFVLAALERLYAQHGRHGDVLRVLKAQAERAGGDPQAARPVLVRLAAALEAQGDYAAAGSHLQRARTMGPRDPDLEEALARVLVRTGRSREAVALLQEQISSARQEGRTPVEVASLLVRLARLQEQQLHDATSARQTLENALELGPGNPEVLRALGELFARQQSWSDYVGVLERLAEVEGNDAEIIGMLISAAVLVKERIGDAQRAVGLCERVLQRDPTHVSAVNMLIELCEQQPARQEAYLRLKCELVDEPCAKASALVLLGQIRRRLGAPPEEVSALYRQALELTPNLPSAVDALSDLLVEQGRLEAARTLLVQAVERMGLSREAGLLYHRLGHVFERLGQDEEGHRYLQDALRLDPRNLPLRVAVGLNRYRAQRWREALRHLQEVREHPDVASHARLAADALFAAGQCEAFLRREDRATAYYEAALELDGEQRQALHELALAALRAHQWAQAASLLQREVALPVSSEERQTLLRLLGELYYEHLENAQEAAHCYGRLLEPFSPQELAKVPTLSTILRVLREAGYHELAARAAEALATDETGAPERRELLLAAAQEWCAAGELEAAIASYRAVLAIDPAHLEATRQLTQLLAGQQRQQEAIALLSRLPPLERSAPAQDLTLRGQLDATLGHLLSAAGDRPGAIAAFERSLRFAEDVAIRATLAELYGTEPRYAASALANHRLLLQSAPERVDSLLVLARESLRAAPYRAYCCYQALQALGALDEEGVSFLANYVPPRLDVDAPYGGEVTEEDRRSLIGLPEVHALQEIFAALWEAAPTLLHRDLSGMGLAAEHRLSPLADSNLARIYSVTGRALGVKQAAFYLRNGSAEPEFQVICMAPPVVAVSAGLVEQRSVTELRFLVGRALELTQPAYILAAGLERGEFAKLFSSVLRAFHPRHMRGRGGLEALEQAGMLRRNVPLKVARRLGELFRAQPSLQFDSGAWRRAVQLSANRVGLVLCGDLGTALRLVLEDEPALRERPLGELLRSVPAVRDLFAFSLSDACYTLRAKLGLTGP